MNVTLKSVVDELAVIGFMPLEECCGAVKVADKIRCLQLIASLLTGGAVSEASVTIDFSSISTEELREILEKSS